MLHLFHKSFLLYNGQKNVKQKTIQEEIYAIRLCSSFAIILTIVMSMWSEGNQKESLKTDKPLTLAP